MKLKTTKGKQFVTGFGVLRIQLNNFFLNVPLHPRTSQCLISILQLLSCQTQTCINTLCASACILFTYRVKPAGELGDKQFCFVNRITPHQTSGSYFLQPPVWLSRRQRRPNLHDSQLMFHLFTHMHTHTHTVNVRKCTNRHFHTYTYTYALKSTCSQRQTLPQTLKMCVSLFQYPIAFPGIPVWEGKLENMPFHHSSENNALRNLLGSSVYPLSVPRWSFWIPKNCADRGKTDLCIFSIRICQFFMDRCQLKSLIVRLNVGH